MKNKKKMSDVEYLVYLRKQNEEMKISILNCCKENQKPKSLSQVYRYMEKRFHLDRTGEMEVDLILQGLCRNLLSMLTACGELEEGKLRSEPTYLTVEKADKSVA